MIDIKGSGWVERLYEITVLAVVLTLPIEWFQFSSVCIAVIAGLWLVDRGRMERFQLAAKNHMSIILGSIVVLYIASLLYTENMAKGLAQFETRFPLLVLPVVILNYYKIDDRKLNIVLATFVVACLAASLICLISTFYRNHLNGLEFNYRNNWYYSSDSLVEKYGIHPSYFSIYCTFAIFVIVSYWKKGKLHGLLTGILILHFLFFEMLLASRIGIIALVLVVGLTIVYEAYERKKLWFGIIGVIGFFVVVAVSIYSFGTTREKFYALVDYKLHTYNKGFTASKRFEEWGADLQVFKENFLFGVGIGDEQVELDKMYARRGFTEGVENSYNPHNMFLETAIITGVLGVIALMGIFYISFRTAIRARNILYLQFLILFVMLSIPEATFSVQKGIVFFALLNSLFIANLQGYENSTPNVGDGPHNHSKWN